MAVVELTKKQIIGAYQEVANTEAGQIMIQDLVRRFGWSRTTLWNTDPGRMAWNEGTRSVVMHIGRFVDVNLNEYTDEEKTGEL